MLNGAGVNLEHYVYTPISLHQEGEKSGDALREDEADGE